MVGPSQQDFRDIELDPDLLSSSFKVQTKWHVITGASSSGKTTLIDLVTASGYQTIPEPGRQYFEGELAKGRSIVDIRENRAALTRHIYGLWLKLLSGLRATEVSFLDRGLPDSLAFYRFAGMNPNQILADCFQHRYASVFMLNRLPYQRDAIRAGDDASAAYFESWMLRDYTALGYDVVRVPVLEPEERLAFIIERLSEQGVM